MTPLKPSIAVIPIGPGEIHPDALPNNVWGSNLRGILPRPQWDVLRLPVADKAQNRCEVCNELSFDKQGRPRRPDCHELWHFESTGGTYVQRLLRLIALCADCHRVQHVGRAQIMGQTREVHKQLKKVNSWNAGEVHRAMEDARERYEWRGGYDWDLDLTLLQGQISIEGHPTLIIPAADRSSLGNSHHPR